MTEYTRVHHGQWRHGVDPLKIHRWLQHDWLVPATTLPSIRMRYDILFAFFIHPKLFKFIILCLTILFIVISVCLTFALPFQNQSTVFCVRCGTPRGIITHWFRSETNRDMAAWARGLVQGSHNAINYQREFSFRCLYQVKQFE